MHLTLEFATRGTPLELIAWEQRRSVLLDWADHGSGRLSVNPDALFGLKDRDKPEGQNTTYFFLEIVRSRESEYEQQQSNFMRKMQAFVAYHAQGKHRERYGIGNFRVITIAPTRQRALNLCEKLRNAGLSSKRFWFADLATVCNEDRAGILEKVFFTSQDYQDGVLYGFRE